MMDLRFSDIVDKMKYHMGTEAVGYSMPLAENYNRVVGNITQGVYTAIAGMPASGTTSFMDQNYVMNVLIQWYFTDFEDRDPLHIKYYSLKINELKKLQQFVCLYIKLVHGLVIDIPTLNNQPGKLYNISDKLNDPSGKFKAALKDAGKFFDEVLNEGVLEIHTGAVSASGIYSAMTDHMDKMGSYDSGVYTLHDANIDSINMVAVDSVENLSKESDGFNAPNLNDSFEKLDSFLGKLSSTYGVNCNATVPAQVGYIRTPKDSEPFTRQLGYFGKNCNRGVVMYNPVQEGNKRLYEDSEVFIGDRSGAILMRYWFVVRNEDGVDSACDRTLFLPGVGYHLEYDKKQDISDNKVTESLLLDPKQSPYFEINLAVLASEDDER